MSAPPELGATDRLPEAREPTRPQIQLLLEDALGSHRRLWVRGRVRGVNGSSNGAVKDRSWWLRWRSRPVHAAAPQTLELETRLSGTVLKTETPLQPDGRFEATFDVELPLARRGWRVARHRVSCSGLTAEACGVMLAPPPEARGAVVVLLPLDYTTQSGGVQRFARSEFASHLTNLLRTLIQGPHGLHPIYYVACVPPEEESRQAEWALAATALGWPAGQFVLLPAGRDDARSAFLAALERFRWLYAGLLELLVLNLEPEMSGSLTAQVEPVEDRAIVRRLINPEDDPWKLLDRRPVKPTWAQRSGPRPTRGSRVPRHPVVFCHGMLAFTTLKMQLPEELNCFGPLRDFLRQRGVQALFPQVPATSGVAERAARLREQILRWTDEPVNLIAHSMGGLDCRYLITHLDMADRVRSLTTVSTPHRGTYLADWFLANFRQRVPLLLAMEAFGINVDGFRDCRPEVCRVFNARTPDQPGVRYFSYGGEVSQARVTPFLRRAWNLLTAIEGPNDGMVSLTSSRWGEYLGTVHADHFAQTPDAVFLRANEDFDALGFYSRLVEDLSRRGF